MSTRHDAISGAYKELYVVENLGTTDEAETLVGYLYDEFTFSTDANEVTIDPNSTEISLTFDTHKNLTVEFSHFYVPPADTLEQLGLLDPDTGELIFDKEWEAARLYLYDKAPDQVTDNTGAVDAWEFPRFLPRMDEMTFPTDSEGSISLTGNINDRPSNIDPSTV